MGVASVNANQDDALTQLSSDVWFTHGRATAPAYARSEEWLSRRVEAIEFVDRRSVRRTVTVDFEIPKGLPSMGDRAAKGTVLVPIAVMQKWPPTMDFQLTDAKGHALSRYKGTTTQKLDFGLLLGMIDLVLGGHRTESWATRHIRDGRIGRRFAHPPSDQIDRSLLVELAEIVENPEPGQERVTRAMNRLNTLVQDVHPFRPGASPRGMGAFEDGVARTVDLAGRLCAGSILWVPVPGPVGDDRIVKFSYLGAHLVSRPKFPDHPSNSALELGKRLAVSCAWRRRTMIIPLLHTGRDVRYHLNIRAPEGSVEMERVTALAMPAADGTNAEGGEPKSLSVAALAAEYRALDQPDEWVGPESIGYLMDYGAPERLACSSPTESVNGNPDATAQIIDRQAHVYLGKKGAPSHRVLLQVKLNAGREGFIRACFLAASAFALLMWLVFDRLEEASIHAEMTVVLLSVIPAILGYVVVSPNEQPFEHEHLKGVRTMALISGIIPLFGALLLILTMKKGHAMDADFPWIRPIWRDLAFLSTAIAAALGLSYLLAAPPRPRNGRSRWFWALLRRA
jgi:hypothetical protein